MRALLFAVALAMGFDAGAQDALSIGSASGPRGMSVSVPVYVRDVSGTSLGQDQSTSSGIRGVAFKLTYSPASAVSAISFSRAGVLAGSPSYEHAATSAGGVGHIVLFTASTALPFEADATPPGNLVGHLSVTLSVDAMAGSTVALNLVTASTALSNATGTIIEAEGSGLVLSNGSVMVEAAPTTATLTSSANPSNAGQLVTFTATVSSAVAGTPTGNVTFKDSATTLGTVPLISGQASYSTSTLSAGPHSITAQYSGDSAFAPTTSTVLSQSVVAPFGAPANVIATGLSTTSVEVSWSAVSGADHYDVYRKAAGGSYGLIGSTAGTVYTDQTAQSERAYLYYIRAVTAQGGLSAPSPVDAATTVSLTDDPLAAGVTEIKAVHFDELRMAVNALRATAGLPTSTFTDGSLAGVLVRAIHIQELRDALSAARTAAALSNISFTDHPLTAGATIRAAHVGEIRAGVK